MSSEKKVKKVYEAKNDKIEKLLAEFRINSAKKGGHELVRPTPQKKEVHAYSEFF